MLRVGAAPLRCHCDQLVGSWRQMSYARQTMSLLNPTAPDKLVDRRSRPYFLWDEDITLEQFRDKLADPDPALRAYFVGKLLRQAKPDDALSFVSLREIDELWPQLSPYLGRRREFWAWLLAWWRNRDGR